jgi:hypothetical protein
MWQDNIKMDLRGMGWDVMDWIHLVHDREQCKTPVKTVMNVLAP